MKTESKTAAGKLANWSIVAVVIAGTLLISGIADVAQGGLMTKIFFFFLGAIIVVQGIPVLMLFFAMIKGLYGLIGKKVKVPVEEKK